MLYGIICYILALKHKKGPLEHLQPVLPSHFILLFQKATLSIIQYNFTLLLASQLLFSYSTH